MTAKQDFADERIAYISEIETLRRRCGELETSLAKEEVRRVKAEEALKHGGHTVSFGARLADCHTLAMVTTRAEGFTDKIARSAMFNAWRMQASEAHLRQRLRSVAVEVRRRGFCGGVSWAAASERAKILPVLAAWRASIGARHQVSALQTKLFAEEACRGDALRTQQSVLEASHMEADARHRGTLRRLRAELVQAEARHASDMALHEASARRHVQEIATDHQPASTGSSTDALGEAEAFARATAELLQEQELEVSQEEFEEFALAAAELLREQELEDSLDEEQ